MRDEEEEERKKETSTGVRCVVGDPLRLANSELDPLHESCQTSPRDACVSSIDSMDARSRERWRGKALQPKTQIDKRHH